MKPYHFQFQCELLSVPGAENVRDIGGYTGSDGRRVRKRRFIRAGGLDRLTDAGVEALRNLGVDCVIDLRSTYESRIRPDVLRYDEHIRYVHVPMLDYIQSSIVSGGGPSFPASMEEMYTGMLDQGKSDFLRVFRLFADPAHRTVLYHCTAGKDRTGITTMLLLGLAGVSRETIAEDYSHSDKLYLQEPAYPDLPQYLFKSYPQTILAAMEHLDRQYGGIAAYLAEIGVDDAMADAILQKLLYPQPQK